MARYSTSTTGTYGTAEAAATAVKLPICVIRKLTAMSITGTGVVYQLRVDFSGMKTPQTYVLPVLNALEGTEVGGGQTAGVSIDVNIPVPSAADVTIYGKASADSQSCVVGVEYDA